MFCSGIICIPVKQSEFYNILGQLLFLCNSGILVMESPELMSSLECMLLANFFHIPGLFSHFVYFVVLFFRWARNYPLFVGDGTSRKDMLCGWQWNNSTPAQYSGDCVMIMEIHRNSRKSQLEHSASFFFTTIYNSAAYNQNKVITCWHCFGLVRLDCFWRISSLDWSSKPVFGLFL